LREKIKQKIKIPFPKAERNKTQKAANDEVRRKRKNLLEKEKRKAFFSYKPIIPPPEQFMMFSAHKKRIISKKLVQQAQKKHEHIHLQQIAKRRARKYGIEYRKMSRQLNAYRKIGKHTNTFFVEPEAKVVFVIRIRGINGVSPKVRKALQLLRLRQIHNGTFVKVNGASLPILKLVEPYITYGPPSFKNC